MFTERLAEVINDSSIEITNIDNEFNKLNIIAQECILKQIKEYIEKLVCEAQE